MFPVRASARPDPVVERVGEIEIALGSKPTSKGPFSWARSAGPLSPPNPRSPVPTAVVMIQDSFGMGAPLLAAKGY